MNVRAASGIAATATVLLAVAACGAGKHARTAGSSSATTSTAQLPGTGHPPIAVGDTNTYPEQFVLGALYEQALAAQGFSVTLNRNIGPPEVRIKALESGSVTFYPEYLDAWNMTNAGYPHNFASAGAAYRTGQRYALDHELELLSPTPFSDTEALAVTFQYAVNHALGSIADLRKLEATLVIGGPPQFQTSTPGLTQLEETYGFVPAAFKSVPVGEQYKALDQNIVQAADVNTTDGELASPDYVLLADPAHVFGWGNVVPVVSLKAIAQEGPAFVTTVNEVSSLLGPRVMRQLNADVAILHEDPAVVAMKFLQAHHLVPVS
jgi:osmoprotectant transport system substrate-binding protein